MKKSFGVAAVASMLAMGSAAADTGSVKVWEVLRIDRTGTHCADD